MFAVAAFYVFHKVSDPNQFAIELRANVDRLNAGCREVRGLTILANEGINTTMAGDRSALEELLSWIEGALGMSEKLDVKWSSCERLPFRRYRIKIRPEIVTTRGVFEPAPVETLLSPEEFERALESGEDVTLLDVRNAYETEVGVFKGAVDPKIANFKDFVGWVKEAHLPKDKKVLMYCTGGIRCEKAATVMKEAGFKEVYQLQGGILRYIEQFPNRKFEGECFVFDRRVAVDQELKPSQTFQLDKHGMPVRIEG